MVEAHLAPVGTHFKACDLNWEPNSIYSLRKPFRLAPAMGEAGEDGARASTLLARHLWCLAAVRGRLVRFPSASRPEAASDGVRGRHDHGHNEAGPVCGLRRGQVSVVGWQDDVRRL